DLDLGHALGGGRDVGQLELGQALVVGGHVALALEGVDLHLGLVVGHGGEDPALAGGDGAVALDERGERAVPRLDAEGVGRDVERGGGGGGGWGAGGGGCGPCVVWRAGVGGVTSSRTSSLPSPAMPRVGMAAPIAIPSAGFTAGLASLPIGRAHV